jgi:hypothetical protein
VTRIGKIRSEASQPASQPTGGEKGEKEGFRFRGFFLDRRHITVFFTYISLDSFQSEVHETE